MSSLRTHYPLSQRLFGPKVTADDMTLLRSRADLEGWTDWLNMIEGMEQIRKKRWLLAYIRDGFIFVKWEPEREDAYSDDNPYEGMG